MKQQQHGGLRCTLTKRVHSKTSESNCCVLKITERTTHTLQKLTEAEDKDGIP